MSNRICYTNGDMIISDFDELVEALREIGYLDQEQTE